MFFTSFNELKTSLFAYKVNTDNESEDLSPKDNEIDISIGATPTHTEGGGPSPMINEIDISPTNSEGDNQSPKDDETDIAARIDTDGNISLSKNFTFQSQKKKFQKNYVTS